MGFWVYLENDEGETLEMDAPTVAGGTYAIGGTTDCEVSVTYNYASHFFKHINTDQGLRWLKGKTVDETLPVLTQALETMKGQPTDDYWEGTEGNAKAIVQLLHNWATAHPSGVWHVS